MKIAIIKLSAMGDIIHSMVALQFIKKKYPEIEIHWIVEKVFAPILENNPDVDKILTLNLKSIKKRRVNIFREIKRVREYSKNSYDLIIDAQGLIKSAFVALLLGKNRWGFDKNSIRERVASYFYNKRVNIRYDENTIYRHTTILSKPLNFDITFKDIDNKKPFLFYKNEEKIIYNYLSKEKKNIILVIGSSWKSKNYPKERFLKIADELQENSLIVWGNEEERERALWIEKHSNFAKAMPKLSLNSLKALISKSDIVIGNDTGPTHIAWAMNIPSITIFGPTPISKTYTTNINRTVKSHSFVNPLKLNRNDFSIRDIQEKEILKIAYELLKKS